MEKEKRIAGSLRCFICCLFTFWSLTLFAQPLNDEARTAFEYLNQIRGNPSGYSKETGVNLSKVKALQPLVWSDTLAKVAELKAMDMAKRKYFAHVNPDGKAINILIHEAGYKLPMEWISDKKLNYFESLSAGTETGIGVIRDLILDKHDAGKGHRRHLLGMNEFYSTLTHCGIGHVKVEGSKYIYYTVVIIAKHR